MVTEYAKIGADICDWLSERGFTLLRNGTVSISRIATEEEKRMCEALKALYPRTKIYLGEVKD